LLVLWGKLIYNLIMKKGFAVFAIFLLYGVCVAGSRSSRRDGITDEAFENFYQGLFDEVYFENLLPSQYYDPTGYYIKAFESDTTLVELLPRILSGLYLNEALDRVAVFGERYFDRLPDRESKRLVVHAEMRLGRIEIANRILERLYKENPQDVTTGLDLVETYYLLGRYEKGFKLVKSIKAQAPDTARVHELLGRYYIYKKDWGKAIENYKRAEKCLPFLSFDPEIYQILGFLYELQGQDSLAITYLERSDFQFGLRGLRPCNTETKKALLRLYLKNDKLKEAKGLLLNNIECFPDYADASILLGWIELNMGNYKNTVEYLEKVIDLGKGNTTVYANLSRAYANLGDSLKAEYCAKLAIWSNPKEIDGYLALVSLYMKAKQYDKAFRVMDDAEFFHPGKKVIYITKAQILFSAARYEDCVEVLNAGLKKYPKDEDLLEFAGEVYFKLKDVDKAILMYERLIKLAPRNARYLNNLGYHLAELGVRLDRALACTEQAIKLVPNSADFIDSYGWVLFKLGRLKEAEYQIRRAIIIDSTIAEIWEHLGDIYWASGKKREAKRVWKKALDMGGVEDEAELREKLNRSD